MPGFKASKNRLTPVRVNALMQPVTFKLKSLIIYHSRALKNYAESALPMLCKWTNTAWMTTHLFTTSFTEYIKPTVQIHYFRQKNNSFKILSIIDNASIHPRSPMRRVMN